MILVQWVPRKQELGTSVARWRSTVILIYALYFNIRTGASRQLTIAPHVSMSRSSTAARNRLRATGLQSLTGSYQSSRALRTVLNST